MSKEELNKMRCKELDFIAKGLNIVGRSRMNKGQLVDAIAAAQVVEEEETKQEVEAKEECPKAEEVKIDMTLKMPYIEKAEIGSLVAFKLPSGKVKSAKIVNRSSVNQKLKLETEYGATYIISYSDVIWVRTGLRWPAGVYRLLKGLASNEEA